jgi:hypothetical protein
VSIAAGSGQRRRLVQLLLAAGVLTSATAGCGGISASTRSAPASRAVGIPIQVTSSSCRYSGALTSTTSHGAESCVYVLSDGERFSCPDALGPPSPSLKTLEETKTCARLTKLVIPAGIRDVFAAIARTHACLTAQRLRVTGGPVFPAQRPHEPDGELILGNGYPEAFVAFYEDPAAAQRKEPRIMRNAGRLRGEVERRGAVTVLWTRPPQRQLRQSLQTCLPR